jgi:hypothetical protein
MMSMAGKDVIGLIPVPAQLLTRLTIEITASATMLSFKLKRVSSTFDSAVFSM